MKFIKYAVELTSENIEEIKKWRTSNLLADRIYGFIHSEFKGHRGYWYPDVMEDYELISWEQFQREVMGIIPKTYKIY